MGIFKRLIGADRESVRRTCIKIYEKAKKRRPGKPEGDYLRIVLITKPPFDYQLDSVIDGILGECSNIEELANYIALSLDNSLSANNPNPLWGFRERNLKMFPQVKERNERFFMEFWR